MLIRDKSKYIKLVPEELLDYDLCELAVRNDHSVLKYISKKYRDNIIEKLNISDEELIELKENE
jgi:hypothetical protein